jgi:hypothetical protein
LQAYYDRTHRRHENSFEETLGTFDLDVQLSCKPWAATCWSWAAATGTRATT